MTPISLDLYERHWYYWRRPLMFLFAPLYLLPAFLIPRFLRSSTLPEMASFALYITVIVVYVYALDFLIYLPKYMFGLIK